MEARLVTSPHKYVLPRVREVAPGPKGATGAEHRKLTQRERVAASLLACPDRGATQK
jgi:hypothetical protein